MTHNGGYIVAVGNVPPWRSHGALQLTGFRANWHKSERHGGTFPTAEIDRFRLIEVCLPESLATENTKDTENSLRSMRSFAAIPQGGAGHNGRRYRLTDVKGQVIHELIG